MYTRHGQKICERSYELREDAKISSLLVLLENVEPRNVRKLIASSGFCAGQNKDFHALVLWQFFNESGKSEKEITHEIDHTLVGKSKIFLSNYMIIISIYYIPT